MTIADGRATVAGDGRTPDYEIAFVIEQVLGHITHGANLRNHVPADPTVSARWVPIAFEPRSAGLRFPLDRANWTVRAGVVARRELRAIERSTKLDAVFFHTQVPATLCADLMRRVPSVISVDATPIQYDELGAHYEHGVRSRPVERTKHRIARSQFHRAAHIVTWSDWARRGLLRDYGVDDERITVIPPGVTVDEWVRPGPPRFGADGSDPDVPVQVLFVGGDLARKGGHVLLDALDAMGDVNVRLHLVTRDPVDPRPNVVVHRGLGPNSPELRRLYHECDVFALPTLGDCLPMVLSEAGAAGLPMISTDVGAIPEVVVDGRTGLLVEPGSVTGLVAALRHLVTRPDVRAHAGAAAAAHVARRYDTATNTAALLSVLKWVAARGAAVPT